MSGRRGRGSKRAAPEPADTAPLPPKVKVRRMEDLESLGDAFFDMVHKQVKASGMPMKDKSKLRGSLFEFHEEVFALAQRFVKEDPHMRPEPVMEAEDEDLAIEVQNVGAQVKELAGKVAEAREELPTFIKEKHTEVSKERTANEAAEAAVQADDAGEEHTEEDEAGGPPLSPSAVQRLQQVFHETQAKVQDTVPVLREQRSAGAETLAALESQRRRAPAAFEEVMAAVPSNPPSSESGGR